MTEFLFWLYPAYIKPYLSTISKDDADALRFFLPNGSLCPAQKKDLEVVIRFYAATAFCWECAPGSDWRERSRLKHPNSILDGLQHPEPSDVLRRNDGGIAVQQHQIGGLAWGKGAPPPLHAVLVGGVCRHGPEGCAGGDAIFRPQHGSAPGDPVYGTPDALEHIRLV